MPRIRSIIAVSLLLAAAGPVASQSLPPTTLAQPTRPPTGTGVGVTTPPAVRPAPIPSTPMQRAGTTSPINSSGPSKMAPITAPLRPVAPIAAPRPVRDAQGRLIPGAQRVSPLRAIDPATGRTFQTTPQPVAPVP